MAFQGLRSTTPPTMPMNPEGLGRSPENTGSFHGAAKPDISVGTGRGGLRITEAVFQDIKKAVTV